MKYQCLVSWKKNIKKIGFAISCNIKSCFLGKNVKLSSVDFAQRVVKVKVYADIEYPNQSNQLALVAQSDARLISDQEVSGLIPGGSGSILSWRLIMKYFLHRSVPFADSRRAVVSFW